MKACKQDDLMFFEWIIELYKKNGSDSLDIERLIQIKDTNNNSCLYHAVESNKNPNLVQFLLSKFFNHDKFT